MAQDAVGDRLQEILGEKTSKIEQRLGNVESRLEIVISALKRVPEAFEELEGKMIERFKAQDAKLDAILKALKLGDKTH